MKTLKRRLLLAVIIVCLIVLIRVFDIDQFITLERLKESRNGLSGFVSDRYPLSVIIYIGTYILVAASSIPGATVLSLAGGFMFGYYSLIYINIGATLGASLAFLASRYFVGGWIQERYGRRLAGLNRELEANGKNYLLTVRLIPIVPFWLINLSGGFTKMPLLTFMWITSLGIIPGSFVYVYFGKQIEAVQNISDIFSYKMVLGLIFIAILFNMPLLYRKFKGGKLSYEHNKQ